MDSNTLYLRSEMNQILWWIGYSRWEYPQGPTGSGLADTIDWNGPCLQGGWGVWFCGIFDQQLGNWGLYCSLSIPLKWETE